MITFWFRRWLCTPALPRLHRHPELTSERQPAFELHPPAVGLGDLAHQLEARAVGSPAVRLQLAAWIGRCRGSCRRAALHKEDDEFPLDPGP